MHHIPQRWHGQRAMRVAGEERFTGRGQRGVDGPIIAAAGIGGEFDRCGDRLVAGEQRVVDSGERSSPSDGVEGDCGFGGEDHLCFGSTDDGDEPRSRDFVAEVLGDGQNGRAAEAVGGSPFFRPIVGDLKFDRQAIAEVVDVGVDAGGEGGADALGIGRVN